jgi:hypothetical protein
MFQLYHGENKLIFNNMMMSALYYTNLICIVLIHWNNRHEAQLWHIILIESQPVFALSS